MEIIKMSSKGQIVIPKTIRERIGATKNDIFVMDASKDVIRIRKIDPKALSSLLWSAREKTPKLTDKEILDEIAAYRKEKANSRRT